MDALLDNQVWFELRQRIVICALIVAVLYAAWCTLVAGWERRKKRHALRNHQSESLETYTVEESEPGHWWVIDSRSKVRMRYFGPECINPEQEARRAARHLNSFGAARRRS